MREDRSRGRPAEDSTDRRWLYGLLAFISAAFLLRTWLSVPMFDDALIGATILRTPYYSEYHGVYLPFFKPFTTALMALRFVPHPWSFASVALVQGLLAGASASVTYVIARRYVPRPVAAAAALVALYALFTLPVPPTRPEGLLLLTILAIVYAADTWLLKRQARYLLAAGALTGGLALPLHTNASIAYIFLAFFALWHARSLRPRDWVLLVGGLAASSVVGLAIVLAPAPGDLPRLLGEHAGESHRFTFIAGEARRLRVLLSPTPLQPAVLFFGAVVLVALVLVRARIPAEWSGSVHRYATLLMLGLAVFVALALLPSAVWSHYLVYYVPVSAVFALIAYEHARPGLRVGAGVGCLVVGAICGEAAARLLLSEHFEAWALIGLVYGVVAAMLLCVSWVSGRRRWLAAALILGVVVRLGLMTAEHGAYADVVDALRARAAESGGVVLGPPEFAWAFAGEDFYPVGKWTETPPRSTGAAAGKEGTGWPDSCTFYDVEPVHVGGFLSNRLAGERWKQWEVGSIACEGGHTTP